MSRPIHQQSIQGASAATQGEEYAAKGHNSLGLFVVAQGLDTAGGDVFTVRLEVEGPEGEWSPIYDDSGTVIGKLTGSEAVDVDSDGSTYNAFTAVHGVPAPSIRANLTDYTETGSGFTIDAYVLGAGNAGTGSAYLSGSV